MTRIWAQFTDGLTGLVDLGGPVVAILLALSVVTLAVVLWKIWQFATLGVSRHTRLNEAMAALDKKQAEDAKVLLEASRNAMAPILRTAVTRQRAKPRVEAETSAHLARLEGGFRLLDSIAQVAPLLGLFGTVLGMIDAFQALQDAGSAVDPSLLAGGIWVALLTTAAGLAVAMPAQLVLTFFESRVARERSLAGVMIETAYGAGAAHEA